MSLLAILPCLIPCTPWAAQGEPKPFPRIDPYTKNAEDAILKAGYSSLGPFRFGDDHSTDEIVTKLGGIPMLWVETKHFKLGSGLPEYTIPDDQEEREHLKAELELLARKLPDVKTRLKKLDPWLRLHLYAQRLEDLYAQFLSAFGLEEGEFPTAPPDPKRKSSAAYMGRGRYLGMSSKYAVLLFEKKGQVGRYSGVYLGKSVEAPWHWHYPAIDAWLYLTAEEFLEGGYANDSALACDVINGVSQNLASGFRGCCVPLPIAVSEGIAHWFSRRFDARYPIFSGTDPGKIRGEDEWNWAPSVRARVEHKVFPSTSDMLGWSDVNELEWADHLFLWSRLDYLLAREDGAAGQFLRRLKEPQADPPTPEQTADRARQALQELTGADLAQFDAEWGEWVLRTYAKK